MSLPGFMGKNCNFTHAMGESWKRIDDNGILVIHAVWNARTSVKKFPDKATARSHMPQPATYNQVTQTTVTVTQETINSNHGHTPAEHAMDQGI
jgi:hypothetical protein